VAQSNGGLEGALGRALQLFALFALALAQPLLELLARHPPFLVAHRATPGDIAGLVAALLLGPPAAAWLLEEIVARWRPRLGRALHRIWIAGLVAATALPVLGRSTALPATVLLAAALALGILAALAFARLRGVRVLATALAIAPFVFVAAFALDPAVAKLLFEREPPEPAAVPIDATTPVVVVIFDELPTTSLLDETGGIDPIRYPAFARLAHHATWFRRASGVHALTEHAIPAILTGRYPDPGRLPIAADHPNNLFTFFADRYALHVSEPFTALFRPPGGEGAPERRLARMGSLAADLSVVYLHVLLPEALRQGLPSVTQGWRDFLTSPGPREATDRGVSFSDRPGRFREFVASIAPGTAPTLHFVHVPLPHVPWQYLPSGRTYYPALDFDFRDNVWGQREWWVVQGYQRHLLQLALVDRLLGELLDRLEAVGLYDAALLVVSADHGASFRAGQSRRDPADMEHPEDVLGVPLFIKRPGQREAKQSLRNVETIDILPTIADLLDARIPWQVDGCSAFDAACPPRPDKLMFSRDDVPMRFDPALLDRRDSLERKLALFGSGSRQNGLFRIGPHRDLVGRRVEEVGVRGPANARAELVRRAFERADRRPDTCALGRVTGVLDRNPTRDEPPTVAVAVGGIIQAVAPAFRSRRGEYLFSAMLPEDAYHFPGESVEVFAVAEADGEPRLLRVPSALARIEVRRLRALAAGPRQPGNP
jgi:hypothetical protein